MPVRSYIFIAIILLGALVSCRKENRCIGGNGKHVKEIRNVPAFTGVKTNGSFEVFVIQDSVRSVVIEAESNIMERIETEVRGSVLELGMKGCTKGHDKIKVYLSSPVFDLAHLNGSGSIQSQNRISASNFSTSISGSGSIIFNLAAAGDIEARISGSGDITLRGIDTADKLDASISGSGDIRAFELPVRHSSAKISGSGDIEVYATETLQASISGSGNVWYKGTPQVSVSSSGSGSVKNK